MGRIGVFICHCGHNIAGSVDVKRVAEIIGGERDVVLSVEYIYMCSTPGQELVERAIKENNLTGLVVAACSPTLHEATFRNAAARAGLNPYRVEIANIREQCSWPHYHEPEEATKKAILIIRAALEKVRRNSALFPIRIPVTPKVLVIGGGVAGIQAALDIADAGYEVYLVEKESSIGGRMVELSETFPTLDCPQCILTPKMTELAQKKNVHIMAYSEIESVSGYVGSFKVVVRHKPTFVNWELCNGCGDCVAKCPVRVSSEFDHALGKRKAIFVPFAQAVPNRVRIDPENCLYFKKGICKVCEKVCERKAIDFDQVERFTNLEVGAILVATGFRLYDISKIGEYGYGKYRDVVDAFQFERLLSASGPTAGVPKRPSDGKIPKRVAFIQCVRSRDPERGVAYCSRVCCMYTSKQALLYRQLVPDGEAYVFYIDIRTNGKGYEEFYTRCRDEAGVVYIRGKVARIVENDGELEIYGVDTLTGRPVRMKFDMVVLAPAMVPSDGVRELAAKLRVPIDEYGWFKEAHLKLRPFESVNSGIFIAGAAQFPKDITDTVAQASAAAAKVVALFSRHEIVKDPLIAKVDEELCVGCGYCVKACPYEAIKLDEKRNLAVVNPALCEGCGGCSVACPSKAITLTNSSPEQILNMIYHHTEEV